jgi:hypothetical protein
MSWNLTAHRTYTVYAKMRLTATGLPGTGLTPTVQTSKNGAALTAIGGTIAELGASGVYKIQLSTADTNTVGGLALLVTEGTCFDELIDCNVRGQPDFTVGSVNDGSPGTMSFLTDLTETVADYWKDADLVFLTGTLSQQRKRVATFDVTGAIQRITLTSAFTGSPVNGDKFCLVNS